MPEVAEAAPVSAESLDDFLRAEEPRIATLYPPTFDELAAIDNAVAGSPRTVRDFIAAEIEATGSNYFVSWLAFGDMTLQESLRSLELFAREVMPAFASMPADAAQ